MLLHLGIEVGAAAYDEVLGPPADEELAAVQKAQVARPEVAAAKAASSNATSAAGEVAVKVFGRPGFI